MKNVYHICFTSHEEVLFRDIEDHDMFVNLMALQSFATGTELLADAEMSTHVHQGVFTDNPMEFARRERMSYTKYFNYKYGREGRFGQKFTYVLKAEGLYHIVTLLTYILRNGLHHAAAATAFGYPFCSVRDMFPIDLGLSTEEAAPMARNDMVSYLPRHAEFPDSFQMNSRGVFVRNSFMELRRAEHFYSTPRNYLYQMNRLTDESWTRDQLKDNTGAPITINDIEHADERTVAQMLNNEYGRNFNRNRLQDIDICTLIDKELIRPYGVSSVYQLTASQKERVARQLKYDYHVGEAQIARCLVLPLPC